MYRCMGTTINDLGGVLKEIEKKIQNPSPEYKECVAVSINVFEGHSSGKGAPEEKIILKISSKPQPPQDH